MQSPICSPSPARIAASNLTPFAAVAHAHHGDYAMPNDDKGIVILGRPDSVLNPGGVRIGAAQIYRQVERLAEVRGSPAIDQDRQHDVRVVRFVRFVRPRPGVAVGAALVKRTRDTIRANTAPRLVPVKVFAVPDSPRTAGGKIVELAVRNKVHVLPVKNTDALANPEALAQHRDLPELATE
jgi:acetoacetyl-CoA synthetase